MFANGPGDLGSIPGRVIPKTQKMVLDASLLNTQHYKVRIKGKVEQSREGVAPSPTHWCSSYRKGSLRVTLDYGRQLLTPRCRGGWYSFFLDCLQFVTLTFMLSLFLSSLARSKYLSLFSLSFIFTLWSIETAKSTIRHVFLLICFAIINTIIIAKYVAKYLLPVLHQ